MANKYVFDTSSVCTHDTTYELNHALVQLIQKSTGRQTHEIMNTIIAETNKMFSELEIDPNSKTAGAKWQKGWGHNSKLQWIPSWNPKRKNKLVTYPGTDIKFNLIINVRWHDQFQQWDPNIVNSYGGKGGWHIKAENCNEIKIKVTLPNKLLKYSTGDMSMLLAEGDILDESSNVEELEIKESKPPKKKKTKTDPIKQENGEEV